MTPKTIKGFFIQKQIDKIHNQTADDFMKVTGHGKNDYTVHPDGTVYDKYDMSFISVDYNASLPVLTNIIAKAIIGYTVQHRKEL